MKIKMITKGLLALFAVAGFAFTSCGPDEEGSLPTRSEPSLSLKGRVYTLGTDLDGKYYYREYPRDERVRARVSDGLGGADIVIAGGYINSGHLNIDIPYPPLNSNVDTDLSVLDKAALQVLGIFYNSSAAGPNASIGGIVQGSGYTDIEMTTEDAKYAVLSLRILNVPEVGTNNPNLPVSPNNPAVTPTDPINVIPGRPNLPSIPPVTFWRPYFPFRTAAGNNLDRAGFTGSDYWGENNVYTGHDVQESVEYIYVDRDVTIRATGNDMNIGSSEVYSFVNVGLELKQGWNAIYTKVETKFIPATGDILNPAYPQDPNSVSDPNNPYKKDQTIVTISVSVGSPDLKWVRF